MPQMFSGGRGSYDPIQAEKARKRREKVANEKRLIEIAKESAYKAVFNSFSDEANAALDAMNSARDNAVAAKKAWEDAIEAVENAERALNALRVRRSQSALEAGNQAESMAESALNDSERNESAIPPDAKKTKPISIAKPIGRRDPDDDDEELPF